MEQTNGIGVIDEGSTFIEIVERWSTERAVLGYVQPYTAEKARQKALLLAPWIGETSVSAIQPQSISRALMALGISGGRKSDGLSSATLRAVHLAGSQAIEWAIKQGAARSNPFAEVARPAAKYRRARFLTMREAQLLSTQMELDFKRAIIQNRVQEASFCLAVCIAIATGLRRGEIFALTWPDVNFDNQRIAVSKAIKGDGLIGEPKSRSSIRSVAFGNTLASLFRDASKLSGRNDHIIRNQDDMPASMNAFEHWWRKRINKLGFAGLRFHELRHTHATLLISGAPTQRRCKQDWGMLPRRSLSPYTPTPSPMPMHQRQPYSMGHCFIRCHKKPGGALPSRQPCKAARFITAV